MGGFITFLVFFTVVAAVLEYTHRHRGLFADPSATDRTLDRDRARVIADLDAHRD